MTTPPRVLLSTTMSTGMRWSKEMLDSRSPKTARSLVMERSGTVLLPGVRVTFFREARPMGVGPVVLLPGTNSDKARLPIWTVCTVGFGIMTLARKLVPSGWALLRSLSDDIEKLGRPLKADGPKQ